MSEALREFLVKVYAIPERRFLWVNITLAAFVALAHGGALVISYAKPTPEAPEIRQLASVSLPIVIVFFATAAAALVNANIRPRVLSLHGIALALGAGSSLLWALGVLLTGLPDGRFSWSLGFLTALVCYSTFMFCRFSLPLRLRSWWGVYYAPIFALTCTVPVDLGVFLRVVR